MYPKTSGDSDQAILLQAVSSYFSFPHSISHDDLLQYSHSSVSDFIHPVCLVSISDVDHQTFSASF